MAAANRSNGTTLDQLDPVWLAEDVTLCLAMGSFSQLVWPDPERGRVRSTSTVRIEAIILGRNLRRSIRFDAPSSYIPESARECETPRAQR
jgi:hypothetical protein